MTAQEQTRASTDETPHDASTNLEGGGSVLPPQDGADLVDQALDGSGASGVVELPQRIEPPFEVAPELPIRGVIEAAPDEIDRASVVVEGNSFERAFEEPVAVQFNILVPECDSVVIHGNSFRVPRTDTIAEAGGETTAPGGGAA